jgi:spermidine synthase
MTKKATTKELRKRTGGSGGAATPSFTMFALILGCFFVSGVTGLTYEILWTRMIVKIIGSSPFAVSIVLTVFMGGLGLGSYLAGRTIDRVKEPRRLVRIYGILELAIAGYAFVLPLLLAAFRPLYAILYNRLFEYFIVYNLLTFVGCALLLIVPVTCMGATLPILSRFFVRSLSRVGTNVGKLYGLNTIGAAVGSLLCGFWLINLLGMWGTLAFAVVLNGLIGTVCIVMSARPTGRAEAPERTASDEERPADIPAPAAHGSFGSYALLIFAVSGFCAMAYEVIWIKLLGLIVGPTTYSFTIVLVTFITGLALGAMFFGWLGDRVKHTIVLLLVTQIAAALFALGFSQLAGNSQIFFAKLIHRFNDSFAYLYLVKAAVLFLFMFPPTFCLGATFPLVGKIYTTSLAHTGRSIGFAYAVNSVGAVLGSFCAGFLLIPFVGKETGLSLVVAMQLATALFVGWRVLGRTRMPALRWMPLALVGCLGVAAVFYYPHWDRKMLSRSRYHRFERPALRNVGWLEAMFPGSARFSERWMTIAPEEELVYYGDGIGGFTTVLRTESLGTTTYALCNSGKTDASYPGDMITQGLLAHFPMLFHPDPRDVLIIGLASGITAGEVLYYPVERLDVVDINEKVVAASEFFREWNNDVLSDPKTRLIIQDGRAHLAMTNRSYDVISSEPSNPWMAGLASLFTRECFELGKARLNDGGIFVQWTHSYEMDWPTFAMIGRTFAEVFPNSMLLNSAPTTDGPDYLLIGVKGDKKLDVRVAAENLKYAQLSNNMTLLDHRLFYNLIVSEDLKELFGDGPVHSENRPYLEFAAPKLLYTSDPTIRHMISRGRRLSESTKEIIDRNSADIDARIDFAAYALSLSSPELVYQEQWALTDATPDQRRRFADLVTNFCRNHVVVDHSRLRDAELREACLAAQIEELRARMVDAKDRVPFLNRLGEMSSKRGALDEAIGYYSELLALEPENVEAHNNIANVLARQKRYDEATVHHFRAIELAPESARALNNLACTLSEQGRSGQALGYFAKALALDPNFADAHYNMGKALASQGKAGDAVVHLTEAVRIKPDYSDANVLLGDLLLAQGEAERAVARYAAALRTHPEDPIGHAGLGSALAAQGKTAEAIDNLSRAVRLDPDYVKALNSLAWILATGSDSRYRDGARAVELARRACELTGYKHPLLMDTLAAAYAEAGEFDRARETAQRAISLARSAGRSQWAQDIETRLELYNRGLAFRAGS